MLIGMYVMGILIVEVIFIIFYVGGKFGQGGYKIFGGFYGVGFFVVNVFLSWLEVEIICDGVIYK